MAWYRAAEKQLIKSGEEDLYKDLFDSIEDFKKVKTGYEKTKEILDKEKPILGIPSKKDREEMEKMISKKNEIERMIEITKKKYREKEIDSETFSKLIADYEKQLVELEVKIETLKSR